MPEYTNKELVELEKAFSGLPYNEELLKKYKINFNESYKNNKGKKKKIRLNKKGKSAVAILTALALAPGAISAIKHLPALERESDFKDAKNYMEEVVFPEILAQNNIETIKTDDGGYFIADFDIEDIRIIESSLVETGYFDNDMARFAVIENFDYNDLIFNVLGYEDAYSYCKSQGYTNMDSLDDLVNSPSAIYRNYHEVEYINSVNSLEQSLNAESEVNSNAR